MTRPSELRILVRNVTNPTFDKRHSYGTKSKSIFSIGSVFLYYPEHQSPGDKYTDPAQAVCYGKGNRSWDAGGSLAVTLYEASEPRTPQNWGDLMCEHGWPRESWASEVLEQLVATEYITLEQAETAYQQVMDKFDAEAA